MLTMILMMMLIADADDDDDDQHKHLAICSQIDSGCGSAEHRIVATPPTITITIFTLILI